MTAHKSVGLLLACCLGQGAAGCATPLEVREAQRVELRSLIGMGSPYPCANVSVVASTPFHIWKDPCDVRYSIIRLHDVQVLRGPCDAIEEAPYRAGVGFLYMEKHEERGTILLAPGFNPFAYGEGAEEFLQGYREIRLANREFDAAFRDIRKRKAAFCWEGEYLSAFLVPLHNSDEAAADQRLIVDHSMLVFLLGLDQLWADLQRTQRNPEKRYGVALVCQSVSDLVQAHTLRWPSWRWTARQQRVIDWCKQNKAEADPNPANAPIDVPGACEIPISHARPQDSFPPP